LKEDDYGDNEIDYYEMNKFSQFRDIAIGPDGEIVLLVDNRSTVDDNENNKAIIVILNKNFDPLGVIGDEKSESHFVNPEGVAISSSKLIAVSDKHQVKKYSIKGNFVSAFGGYGEENCQFRGLAYNSNNILYVADGVNYRVQVFNEDDTIAFSFGSESVGQFQQPVKITIDPSNNNIIVCDDTSDAFYVFDKTGNFICKIPCDNLMDITVDPTGYVITGHIGSRNSIRIWNPFYQCIGYKHFKQDDKEFESINAVAISSTGTLYIVESWQDSKDILKEILKI